jgi:hypothetical protein
MPQKKFPFKAATTTPTVSGRWILAAAGLAIAAAVVCSWGVLCLLFWQGSWQLLYRPKAEVTRTPASVGLGFDSIGLATTEAGEARLRGWWIPAGADSRYSRYTVLFLHGQDGNLSDTVEAVAALHSVGVNVLAFDYRGYGQSQFAKPSEAHWREDAESALLYLTRTRHVDAGSIVLDGRELGANLALEMAAQHTELAGVILRGPLETPVQAIFNDGRARLVPAHALVQDRFDLNGPAAQLRIPSLWFYETAAPGQMGLPEMPDAFQKAAGPKMLVWLTEFPHTEKNSENALSCWLGDLPNRGRNLPLSEFGNGFAC